MVDLTFDGVSAALAVVAVSLLLLLHFRQKRQRSPNVLSVPGELPIIGHSILLSRNQDRLLEWLLGGTLLAKGKPWYFKVIGQSPFVCISSPDSVKHVLQDNFDNYVKGDFFRDKFFELLGDGIFDVDGPEWSYQRKTASHLFSRKELKGFMTEVFVRHAHLVMDKVEGYANSGQPFDIQDLFYRYTLESIGQIAYGVHLGCFEKEVVEFAVNFDTAQRIIMERVVDPLWHVRKLLKALHPDERTLIQCVKNLDSFARSVIRERQESDDLRDREDLLSRFMALRDEQGNALDETRLRDVVMSFVIAGRDTTANCLTWVFYELFKNPDCCTKLQAAIDEVTQGDEPTYEAVHEKIPYVHHVVKETLRLHPSVPKDVKTAVNDDVLPDGTKIKAGTNVVYMPWVMGRLDELWEDALTFKPERWENTTATHFKYTAFNAGPRLCLGMNMAYLEAQFLIVMLLQKYNINVLPDQCFDYQVTLTMPMKHGLKVTATPRV
eukprot:m.7910 g.7910  ORF g.7910 m.7910 type:complete len:494 (-) comp5332_c0_seq1:233-1714(-)